MSKGKVFVFMVTGDQGSSVAKFLLEDGWSVVGLTRNPDGENAKGEYKIGRHRGELQGIEVSLSGMLKVLYLWLTSTDLTALAKAGVELVKGDLASVSSYEPALKGCDGVFVNGDCE